MSQNESWRRFIVVNVKGSNITISETEYGIKQSINQPINRNDNKYNYS